ncbi:MAG: META domain-containing protein [Microcoleaceae cyanobacterium]
MNATEIPPITTISQTNSINDAITLKDTWTLVEWQSPLEQKKMIPGVKVTLEIADNQISGSSGCNQYRTSYQIEADVLKIGPAASTRRACPEPIMQQELQYLTALQAAERYEINDQNQLEITYGNTGVLVFEAPFKTSLEDSSWSLVDQPRIIVSFTADRISGYSGCNNYMGSYQIQEERLEVGLLASTERACISETIGLQEYQFLNQLQNATYYEMNPEGQLEIFYETSEDAGSMIFTPQI